MAEALPSGSARRAGSRLAGAGALQDLRARAASHVSRALGHLGVGALDRYLMRQLLSPMALSLGLILSALMLDKALRLVASLSQSEGRLGFLAPLMASLLPYYLDTALPFAFFAAVLLVVTALDDRGEVEAILASGVSPDLT